VGAPRLHEELADEGETVSPSQMVRIMANAGLHEIPQRRQ